MSIVSEKSKRLAIRIIRLYKYLIHIKRNLYCQNRSCAQVHPSEPILQKLNMQSVEKIFSLKYIALKETGETLYWLELLYETGYLNEKQYQSVYYDLNEIRKMLSSTTKTMLKESCNKKAEQ